MGIDIGFHIVSRQSGGDSKPENQVSCLAKYKSRVCPDLKTGQK